MTPCEPQHACIKKHCLGWRVAKPEKWINERQSCNKAGYCECTIMLILSCRYHCLPLEYCLSMNIITSLLGLSLLCSENCLLCFLALLQFCAYYAKFYATPQSIMLVVLHSLIQKPARNLTYHMPVVIMIILMVPNIIIIATTKEL